MWGILKSKWVRGVVTVEGLGAFSQQAWGFVSYALAGVAAVTGAVVGVLDGYGWTGIALLAFGFAFLMLCMLWLVPRVVSSWRRAPREPHTNTARLDHPRAEPRAISEREETALNELTYFVNHHLLDTIQSLHHLQAAMIAISPDDDYVKSLAIKGLWHKDYEVEVLFENYRALNDLGCSPPRDFTLEEMTTHVAFIERTYAALCRNGTKPSCAGCAAVGGLYPAGLTTRLDSACVVRSFSPPCGYSFKDLRALSCLSACGCSPASVGHWTLSDGQPPQMTWTSL